MLTTLYDSISKSHFLAVALNFAEEKGSDMTRIRSACGPREREEEGVNSGSGIKRNA